jgi:type I restriction enzyme S subunit
MSKPWPLMALGEVLTHFQEYVNAPEARIYSKLSVKLYGKGAVLDAPADGATLKMKRHQLAKAGQVILSEIWGKKGAIGIVPPEGEGALCTSHFFLFGVRHDRLDPKWLQAIFTANYLQAQLDADAKGTTGYAAVRPKNLLAASIPLPPLAEQQRIVTRIDELTVKIDEARRLRRQALEEAEALVHSTSRRIFSEAITQGSAELQSLCTDIIDCLHSNAIYADKGIPTLRSPDVGWGRLILHKALKTSEEEYQRRTQRGALIPDDIIIVREGGGTGKAGIVEEGQRMSLGQRVMQVRLDRDKIIPRFFLHQWLSPLIQKDLIIPLSKGSASPHLNIGTIRKFQIALPPLTEQHRIVAYLEDLQTKLDSLKRLQTETAAKLDAMLPSILDKAFKGEL